MVSVGTIPLPAAAQDQQRDLQWTVIEKPGIDGFVVVHPSDVSDIAIGSSVFYAIDVNHARVYRSMSGGLRWENISLNLARAGATLPATKIAVAPDEAAIVAAATDGGTALYMSVDGGITWANVNIGPLAPGTMIQSIAISRSYTQGDRKQRDVLVGTALFGNATTTGQVWLLHLGSVVPRWANLNIRVDPAFIGGEVSAVAFSPRYSEDMTILAVASTSSDVALAYQNRTYLCMGLMDLTRGVINKWYSNADGAPYNVYPIEIFDPVFYPGYTKSVGDGPGVTSIGGGLALPGSFDGSSTTANARRVYAFYTVQPAPANDTSNAYRVDDSVAPFVTAFTPFGGVPSRYSSIALSGRILVAGEVMPDPLVPWTVPVHISLDATTTPPVFTQKGNPYGQGNAKVAWSSNVLYCGTGNNPTLPPPVNPDESGFSISNDNGAHWVQVGLIDTNVLLQDVAAASSPQSIFITSTDTSNVESVWRSAGEPLGDYWGRVLAVDVPSNKIIVRLSPQYRDDYTVYVCEVNHGTGLIPDYSQAWVTHDRGNAWNRRTAPLGIIDLAVAEKKVAYIALPDGKIAKTVTAGMFWQNAVPSELDGINMLSLVDADTVFVGGTRGDVAYSSDGGADYVRLPKTLTIMGPVQVEADSQYKKNSLIYASSGNTIYRWAIGRSQDWEIIRTTNAGRQVSGMLSAGGVLYGLWYNTGGAGSGAERSLAPTLSLMLLEWDTIQVGAQAATFSSAPTSLRYSLTPTTIILWTIDDPGTIDSNVMVYFDCVALKGPVPTLANGTIIGCDPVSGRNQEVNFTWNDICADDRYQLQIAKDDKFSLRVFDSGNDWPFFLPPVVTAPALVYATAGGNAAPALIGVNEPLECGHTYYWRVRARAAVTGEIVRSPWSEVRSFTLKAGLPVTSVYYGLTLLSPSNGCAGCPVSPASFSWSPYKETTRYKFVLARNSEMTDVIAEATTTTTGYEYRGKLGYSTNYFWRVMAVEPTPSDWSAAFSFQTQPEPAPSPIAPTTSPLDIIPLWVWTLSGVFLLTTLMAITIMILLASNREG